jgi:LuxR family maltose regulon positive regulatory protein
MQRVEREEFARTAAISKLSVRRAYIDYRRNNLNEAMLHARKSIDYAKQQTDPEPLLRAYHVESFILVALGKAREASELMQEARAVARASKSALRIWSVETSSVELALMLGDTEAVSLWEEKRGQSINQPFSSVYERESILAAKWALVQGDFQKATSLIAMLRPQSVVRQRLDSILTMDIIHAAALNAMGATDEARTVLETAVAFAQPEGYLRPFVNYASDLHELLLSLRKSMQGSVRIYIPEIIKACNAELQPASSKKSIELEFGVVLTPRETEMLQFVYAGMTNKEIAETTFVSLSTVKTHVNRIFSKLDVGNRQEMIVRVRELGLV